MEDKTALVLGGGGARGAYEIGVWKACREEGMVIDIVTGASVGSINGAMVAQDDFDLAEQLWQEIETEMVLDVHTQAKSGTPKDTNREVEGPEGTKGEVEKLEPEEVLAFIKSAFINKGVSTKGLEELLRKYIDEDRVRKSRVEYGLVTAEMPSLKEKQILKGHWLFCEDIPQGRLHDFIMASASYFPAMQPHEIDGVVYIDGGYVDTVPVSMAVKRGATKVIAVELNPENPLTKRESKAHDNLTWITSPWDLGGILVFNKVNATRIMGLGYLDGRKAFGRNEGHYFTFEQGAFAKDELTNADCAAKVFGIDPLVIYSKGSLNRELSETIKKLKAKKKSEAFSTPMLTLSAAEKINGLPKEAIDFIKDYSGVILKEEKNAIRYLLANIL
jgi:NTE family protein